MYYDFHEVILKMVAPQGCGKKGGGRRIEIMKLKQLLDEQSL